MAGRARCLSKMDKGLKGREALLNLGVKKDFMGTMEATIVPEVGGKKTDIETMYFRSQCFYKESEKQ